MIYAYIIVNMYEVLTIQSLTVLWVDIFCRQNGCERVVMKYDFLTGLPTNTFGIHRIYIVALDKGKQFKPGTPFTKMV